MRGAAQDTPGAVVLLALNLDPQRDAVVSIPEMAGGPFELYAVTAPDLLGQIVLFNGIELNVAGDGTPPETPGVWQPASAEFEGGIRIHPLSYTFIRFHPG